MSTDKLVAALSVRSLADLIGLEEDETFDAKAGVGYDLDTETGRLELAKDVSSFANAEGGRILLGVVTEARMERSVDVITALDLMPEASLPTARISGVVREYLYPPISGLRVGWVEDVAGAGLGIGVIEIPRALNEQRPIVITRIAHDGDRRRSIVLGLATRGGANSVPHSPRDLHRLLKRGIDPTKDSLERIEAKLDEVLSQVSPAEAEGQQERETQRMAELRKRIDDIVRQ